MRTKLFLIISILVLLFIAVFIGTPQLIPNPIPDIRYRWSHFNARIVDSLDPMVFEKFNITDTGGGFGSSNVYFNYASRYDANARTYYYKFTNKKENLFCAKSELLALLTGKSEIRLSPGETKYFILTNDHAPVKKPSEVRLYSSCKWYDWAGTTGMTLVMPTQ